MNVELKVDGMHCQACMNLIRMEIEDSGFEDKITDIKLNNDNTGVVILNNVSNEEIGKISESINNLENYKVVKE